MIGVEHIGMKKKLVVFGMEGMDWIIVPDVYMARIQEFLAAHPKLGSKGIAEFLEINDIQHAQVISDGENITVNQYPAPKAYFEVEGSNNGK